MTQIEAKSQIKVAVKEPESDSCQPEPEETPSENGDLLKMLDVLDRDDLTAEQLEAISLLRQGLAGQSLSETG